MRNSIILGISLVHFSHYGILIWNALQIAFDYMEIFYVFILTSLFMISFYFQFCLKGSERVTRHFSFWELMSIFVFTSRNLNPKRKKLELNETGELWISVWNMNGIFHLKAHFHFNLWSGKLCKWTLKCFFMNSTSESFNEIF